VNKYSKAYVKGLLFDFLKSKKNAVLMCKEVGRQLYRKWREGCFLGREDRCRSEERGERSVGRLGRY
jgi:hypothetical protein